MFINITDHVAYASTNKTKIVLIETELFSFFLTRGGCVSCLHGFLGIGQLCRGEESPFSGIISSGRVWRKVPESSVGSRVYALILGLRTEIYFQGSKAGDMFSQPTCIQTGQQGNDDTHDNEGVL